MSSFQTSTAAYRPEAIWHARRAFFDEGRAVEGLIEAAVVRSWMRCSGSGHTVHEAVEFAPVDRQTVAHLLERNQALVHAGRPELESLARSVREAGYAVLLTDAQGQALAVDGAIAARSAPLRQAFREGVDLSEASIGTNAMCVAISEQRPARVLGAEHFFADTQIFHCCAAPVFDPQGQVIGAVDVSCDMPGMLQSALWLSQRCAQRIERRLFRDVPAFLQLEIDVGDVASADSTRAWLAFGEDGQLLAASRGARQLIGLPRDSALPNFGSLFEGRFEPLVSRLRCSDASVELTLQGGVRLRAQALPTDPLSRPRVAVSSMPRRTDEPATRPRFGDERIDRGFDRALRAFRADLPVLLTGETGCGKDVAARALHALGPRPSGPFVALNCAAIPAELLAGELFGHIEGAFTGSRRGGAPGKIEAADGGTLFLDEIGDMPLALQAALLRVLDGKEIVRLGATTAKPVSLRVVCATHRDLHQWVAESRFREDLYYRIAGHILHLLPLRERDDFDAVLESLLLQAGCPSSRVPEDVRRQLRAGDWPGNVRQLAHAIRRAIALAEPGAPFSAEDFELPAQPGACALQGTVNGKGWLQYAEHRLIEDALRQADGKVTEAARLLGIGRATLYRKLSVQRQ